MKKRNVIIDCDPGVDDAVMLALAAAHREELEILGITTVSGNQDIKKVTANALNLAEFYGYKASIANSEDANEPWKSPVCMPKEAARIWLKVTNARVERLQKITEDGCIAEGVYPSNCRGCNATFGCDNCPDEGYNEIDEFSEIWDSTVKKSDIDRYSWDANPWVFVYEFEHCEKPKEE